MEFRINRRYGILIAIARHLVRSGAFSMILEKPRERFILTPGRTHNRSRSPRIGSKDWVYWASVRRFGEMREEVFGWDPAFRLAGWPWLCWATGTSAL
ncbi:unnamed protein product [Rhizophagus irregularis]|nr:unnamed protein product [Rhizophagus irregularis]